ncbi:hypothetical protein FOL47_002554, partial [Perkinsus chesapeaki]
MPRHLNWTQENQFTGIPTGSNAFKVALDRLKLDYAPLLSYRRDNYAVYHCGDHLGCPKKWKLVKEGNCITVFTSGEHGPIERVRSRTRHPQKILSDVVDQASKHHMTASDIFTNLTADHKEYVDAGKITKQQVQNIISGLPRRRDLGMPHIGNFFELEEAFEDSRIDQELIDYIIEDKAPAKEFIFHGGYWSDNFACIVGGASMLASLLWFIRSMPSGFPLYMDAQNKIIRGSQKVAWVGSSRI